MFCSAPTRMFFLSLLFSVLLAPSLSAADTVVFKDRTGELGISPGGSQACWVDFDNDGFTDLIVGGGVWRNEGGKKFTRITGAPGTGVSADFNNDGFPDLFCWSNLTLYRNEGGKSLAKVALPKLPPCVSRGACWGDFNGDGFADVYVGGYENWGKGITYTSFVLLNNKGESFSVGWKDARFRARGVTACDFDQDGDLDVYASNYRLQPNLLLINDGKGNFTESAAKYNAVATSKGFGGGHSIGSCWGDFNSDGLIDLFAGNFAHRDGRGDQPKSRFLKNLGPDKGYKFEDLGTRGVFYQESYASPTVGDYDNDGNLDLFFTTVYGTASFGRKNYPVLFHNNGQVAVTDVTTAAGIGKLGPTYQAAFADYDNDGDLDLISGGRLFENQGSKNHWLKVRLSGDGKRVNRSAIGAQVRVKAGDKIVTRQVEAGTGEGNQNDLTLHFGLGAHSEPVTIEIAWPNKTTQTLQAQQVDRLVKVELKK